jgi:putative ABC transport system permease protein
VSRVDYYDFRELNQSFDQLAAMTDFTVQHTVTGGSRPELVQAAYVTWNVFPALGVNPVVGRGFLADDEVDGGDRLVVISYAYWQSRFGGATQAIGSSLTLDGIPMTVIGVMPPDFRFLIDADAWRLVDHNGPYDLQRDSHSHIVVGRIKPGVTLAQAQEDVSTIARGLAAQYPESNTGKGMQLTALQSYMVSSVRVSLLLLLATTVLVLIVACANVAGLMLARSERRRTEMAMRSALGASRGRMVRQLLTESVILTVAAGLLGTVLAYLLQGVSVQLLPTGEVGLERPAINAWALGFALFVAVAMGLLIGVIPAMRGANLHPAQQLRSGTHATEGVRGARLRSGLVVLQVAATVVLLIGSGLLIRSFAHLSSVELGFDDHNLLTGQLQIQGTSYPTPEERHQFYTTLLDEVETIPGVESATLSSRLPIRSRWQDWSVWPADQPPPTAPGSPSAMVRWVSPGYFRTMGIPFTDGRGFDVTDAYGSPYVTILSERAVQNVYPDVDPVGRAVKIGWDDREFRVIGVVADARINTLRGTPDAAAYMTTTQFPATRLQIAVRTTIDPTQLVRPIEDLLQAKDPNAVFSWPATMESVVDDELSGSRIITVSLVLFSGLALLLAAIGLYGVLAYHVGQRINEFGIRLAMGATAADLLGMVLRRGLLLVVIGLVVGIVAAYPGTLLIRQLLYETQTIDIASYAGAALFLALVGAAACLLPAWRATRVDVVEVLRIE